MTWGHHCLIITKCKEVDEALYYLLRTIEIGLSRSALDDCIRADLYHTSGAAVTNFAEKLPPVQGALAKEILKSNYDFGFVSLPDGFDEDALEGVLEQRMTRFLMEAAFGTIIKCWSNMHHALMMTIFSCFCQKA